MPRCTYPVSSSFGIAALTLALTTGPAVAAPVSAASAVPVPTTSAATQQESSQASAVSVTEAVDVELVVTQNAAGGLVVELPAALSGASKQSVTYLTPDGQVASAHIDGFQAIVPAGDGVTEIRYLEADYTAHTILGIGEAVATVQNGELVSVSTPNRPRGQQIEVRHNGRAAVRITVPAGQEDTVNWSLSRGNEIVRLDTDQTSTRVADLSDGTYILAASSGDRVGPLQATTITFTVHNGWIID